ncbi:Coenzyme Q-binding protein COQ10 like protein, mitochondrial [Termitomyces sp. J132]|nr:hypothetical protein H2248_006305 [Termitomyces sp. 'cryptogamus']KNZ79837.1 Coenzyme Q-binding protein COQ10 like protein, mitochondrial [Termitomyces sp. J132]
MYRPVLCSSHRTLLHRTNGSRRTRTFFSLPNLSDIAPWNSQPHKYHERKILPYDQKELYAVVSDVGSYHQFVPFCTGSRIVTPLHRQSPERHIQGTMEAELTVGFLTFTESYVSQVTCKPYESVEAVASTATPLFKALTTTWRFQPVSARSPQSFESPSALRIDQNGAKSTLVTLDLMYAFSNPIHASVSSGFFGQVSKLMVKAFEDRCIAIYGPRSA